MLYMFLPKKEKPVVNHKAIIKPPLGAIRLKYKISTAVIPTKPTLKKAAPMLVSSM